MAENDRGRPALLDKPDRSVLAMLGIYSVLVLWTLVLLGLALGLAVRVFEIAKGA